MENVDFGIHFNDSALNVRQRCIAKLYCATLTRNDKSQSLGYGNKIAFTRPIKMRRFNRASEIECANEAVCGCHTLAVVSASHLESVKTKSVLSYLIDPLQRHCFRLFRVEGGRKGTARGEGMGCRTEKNLNWWPMFIFCVFTYTSSTFRVVDLCQPSIYLLSGLLFISINLQYVFVMMSSEAKP